MSVEKLMNEVCYHLALVERNGIKIDVKALDEIEKEYKAEQLELKVKLDKIKRKVMGAYPINLDSPTDVSILVYSRKIKDKNDWKDTFNLGTEKKFGRRVQRRKKQYKPKLFNHLVNDMTAVITRCEAIQCNECEGTGRQEKFTKLGQPYKNQPRCEECNGEGIKYIPTLPIQAAGLKCIPKNVNDIAATGFVTNKEKLEELAQNVTGEAKEFLQALVRLNAVNHYLSNFVDGIRKNLTGDDVLHTEYMQCVTATGRLSSRNPNYHNQPRGHTFPIRRVVVSRWEGGCITDADYGQLEFREAAELSGCPVAAKDIADGIDVHQRTSDILSDAGQLTDRQGAKTHTFKPLYGGTSGTKAEQTYYQSFLSRYKGIAKWHDILCNDALGNGFISLPSGRIYKFPYAKRYSNGSVSGKTKIVNYPVQGFATADIVPLAFVEVSRAIIRGRHKSLLINEVHDSIVVDTYPGEEKQIAELLEEVMVNIDKQVLERWDYQLKIPLVVDVKQGPNWLDMEVV